MNNLPKDTPDTEHSESYAFKASQHAFQLIKDHPYRTGGIVLGAVPLLAPAAVGGGILGAIGFGSLGPVAGSFAATTQATMAPVAAGSVFATLQSAAMGGYGAAAVFGAVQGTAVAGLAASFLPSRKRTPKEGDYDDIANDKDAEEVDSDVGDEPV